LRNKNTVFTGAQGLTAVYEAFPEWFPKNKWTVSFGGMNTKSSFINDYVVPGFFNRPPSQHFFGFGDFRIVWGSGNCLVAFFKI
jgi:hypothetical protein